MAGVFISGATGFLGRALAAGLMRRGHSVRGLARQGSESRVAAGCEGVTGNPLDSSTFAHFVPPADTFVQLVGVAHPSPAKAAEFRLVDLPAARAGVEAALSAGIKHFIYVSVAQPAPVMHEYVAARREGEAAIRACGINATILRPWYVLGPGRRWPTLLRPMYFIAERLPRTRETARRLGLVTLPQMVAAMIRAVESPPDGIRILDVSDIRDSRSL